MLNNVFLFLLKMSLQASILIFVVIITRMIIRNVPKIYFCVLWLLILIRLLCPIFIESEFSLTPRISERFNDKVTYTTTAGYTRNIPFSHTFDNTVLDADDIDTIQVDKVNIKDELNKSKRTLSWQGILYSVWMIGIVLLATYHIRQYVFMKKKMRTAIHIHKNVWEYEGDMSPFVMFFFKPRIYIPSGLPEFERNYIIKHEMMHIKHFDPQIRFMEIIALCIHWWNPMVWVFIHIMNQDMEMFCDEEVLKNTGIDERKEYLSTLLNFAMKQSGLSVAISFGESNTEKRIKHIVKWRKPIKSVRFLLIFLIAACAILLFTVPGLKNSEAMSTDDGNDVIEVGKISDVSKENEIGELTDIEPVDELKDVTDSGKQNDPHMEKIDDINITNETEFVELIIECLESGKNNVLASLIKYPVTVYIDNNRIVLYEPGDLVGNYDRIFTDEFKDIILSTDTKNLFQNYYGVMLKNGSVWLDCFTDLGYRIYAINNRVNYVVTGQYDFKTDWTNKSQYLDISLSEMNLRYANLMDLVPQAEMCYKLQAVNYEDLDQNGKMDLMLILTLMPGSITTDEYPLAYVCMFINDDPVYIQSSGNPMYMFLQILCADVDNDGHPEIIYNIFTGGNGGAGSSEKTILKYKNHTLVQMQFPGDGSEQFSTGSDIGYQVTVLFGEKENEYIAVCNSLNKEFLFKGKYAVDQEGNRFVKYIKPRTQAGGNCRGFTEFQIVNTNGREYLLAKEYLFGEAGIVHSIGWATFLIDWDKKENPYVIEFQVEEL